MDIDPKEVTALRREKYAGRSDADMTADLARLTKGEPLAYVIGHQPFLGLTIDLSSRPLIPRPETEWWTELLIARINESHAPVNRRGSDNDTIYSITPDISLLDLCAGSGAVGLAVLKYCPRALVSFGELIPEHAGQIRKNRALNDLDASRADIRSGDLFEPFGTTRWNIIAANPPYIPSGRTLGESVTGYEPPEALFGGEDGLDLIRRILHEAPSRLLPSGELWMECDTAHIGEAAQLARDSGARTEVRQDNYGRPRLLVAYY